MKEDITEKIWKKLQSEIRDEVPSTTITTTTLHPALAVGLGGFFLLHVMTLLSLPPVLRGKGAPYLPSFQKKLDIMFTQLRKDAHLIKKLEEGKALQFVDLGSGDGRVVFRAAREGIFQKCTGYEINPGKLLHTKGFGAKCNVASFTHHSILSTCCEQCCISLLNRVGGCKLRNTCLAPILF
jgi:hypothetical protein